MSDSHKMTDAQAIKDGTSLVAWSTVGFWASGRAFDTERRPGYMLLVAETHFNTLPTTGGAIDCRDTAGEPIEGSLEDFLAGRKADPECLGIVPVTQGAKDAIDRYGLAEIGRGTIIPERNYRAIVYGS